MTALSVLAWPLTALLMTGALSALYWARFVRYRELTREQMAVTTRLQRQFTEATTEVTTLCTHLNERMSQIQERVDVIDNRTASPEAQAFQPRRRVL